MKHSALVCAIVLCALIAAASGSSVRVNIDDPEYVQQMVLPFEDFYNWDVAVDSDAGKLYCIGVDSIGPLLLKVDLLTWSIESNLTLNFVNAYSPPNVESAPSLLIDKSNDTLYVLFSLNGNNNLYQVSMTDMSVIASGDPNHGYNQGHLTIDHNLGLLMWSNNGNAISFQPIADLTYSQTQYSHSSICGYGTVAYEHSTSRLYSVCGGSPVQFWAYDVDPGAGPDLMPTPESFGDQVDEVEYISPDIAFINPVTGALVVAGNDGDTFRVAQYNTTDYTLVGSVAEDLDYYSLSSGDEWDLYTIDTETSTLYAPVDLTSNVLVRRLLRSGSVSAPYGLGRVNLSSFSVLPVLEESTLMTVMLGDGMTGYVPMLRMDPSGGRLYAIGSNSSNLILAEFKASACRAGTAVVDNSFPRGCIPCAAGTFSNGGVCEACPAGFYSEALSSSCTACAEGTYAEAGSAACLPCTFNHFCPAATAEPLLGSKPNTTNVATSTSIPPPAAPIIDPIVPQYLYISAGAIAGVMLLSLAATLSTPTSGLFIKQFDIFFQSSHTYGASKALVNRQTVVGGTVSLILMFVVPLVCGAYVLNAFNGTETVSALFTAETISFTSSYTAQTTFFGLSQSCVVAGSTCDPSIFVNTTGVTGTSSYSCSATSQGCQVTWTCPSCALDLTAKVTVTASKMINAYTSVYAAGVLYSFSAASLTSTNNVVSGSFLADTGYLFRGTTSPSQASVDLSTTMYKRDGVYLGMANVPVLRGSPVKGSQVLPLSLWSASPTNNNGVAFVLILNSQSGYWSTEAKSDVAVIQVLAGLAGLLCGMMAVGKGAMVGLETLHLRARKGKVSPDKYAPVETIAVSPKRENMPNAWHKVRPTQLVEEDIEME
eukprot:GILK01004883.1.p1 GENE.GILK01004883.1~~GILK01004883.1.p1  ORF type:complete len:890 (-),score=98.31 GILK01004883.1:222-2861(-)